MSIKQLNLKISAECKLISKQIIKEIQIPQSSPRYYEIQKRTFTLTICNNSFLESHLFTKHNNSNMHSKIEILI